MVAVLVTRNLNMQWATLDQYTFTSGVEGASLLLKKRLVDELEKEVIQLNSELALAEGFLTTDGFSKILPSIPDGIKIGSRDQIDEWPAIFIVPQDTGRVGEASRTEMQEVNEISITYVYTYRFKLFVWVRGQTYEETEILRDRLALCVRRAFLRNPKLSSAGSVVPDTVQESYSDVGAGEAGRSIAGAWLECQVRNEETIPQIITADLDNTANTITVEEELL